MISLLNLQREMLGFALGEGATAPNEWIVENSLSAARRLGVYRNNAHIGFAKALQAIFPVLVRLGGEDWFNQTALYYQRVHPSRSGDLGEVGSALSSFLAATLHGGDHEYFADVARLELSALPDQSHGRSDRVSVSIVRDLDEQSMRR